jgi:N utilization substance protein B
LRRRTARKQAFLALYQSDINERPLEDTLKLWRSYKGEFDGYALSLTEGVARECEDLDARLSEVSIGWTVRRMSVVDRAILRLALYEMIYVDDVPPEVAISEAVELATGFSSDEAPAFIGGVLRGAEGRNLLERVEHG